MKSIYMLVEGEKTEPAIYRAWLPLLFPGMREARTPEDAIEGNAFYMLAGYGYPSIKTRLRDAIADVNSFGGFGHLVVALDSEEMEPIMIRTEIERLIDAEGCPVPSSVIVANCAMETWLLGNRRFIKRNPESEALRGFRSSYDVIENDPELLPNLDTQRFNTRAQYHHEYLRAAFVERGLRYRKNNPGEAASASYFEEICARALAAVEPKHLQSFQMLLALAKLSSD